MLLLKQTIHVAYAQSINPYYDAHDINTVGIITTVPLMYDNECYVGFKLFYSYL